MRRAVGLRRYTPPMRGALPRRRHRCHPAHEERLAASATPVPPFALFEFVSLHLSNALRANNAKSGTLPVEARSVCRLGWHLARRSGRHSSLGVAEARSDYRVGPTVAEESC
jgi:hypothetical protein